MTSDNLYNRFDRTWFLSDTPSYESGGNITPVAFMNLVLSVIRQARPSISASISDPDVQYEVPHISVELRSRRPHDGQEPKLLHRNGRFSYEQRQFFHVFRFRIYGRTQIEAEEEGSLFERLIQDYKPFLARGGVKRIFLDMGLSGSQDVGGVLPNLSHVVRDYNVLLAELNVKEEQPIKVITLREYIHHKLHTDIIDVDRMVENESILTHNPDKIISVTQDGYVFIEGLDFETTADGILWLFKDPPVPHQVNYLHRDYFLQRDIADPGI